MEHMGGLELHLHLFLSSAVDGCECSASRLGRFFPRENSKRLGGPQGQSGISGEEINLFRLPGFKRRIIQPVP
jgi:hypothetical protein